MKSATFARFALLLPLILWGVCLLVLILAVEYHPQYLDFDGLPGFQELPVWLVFMYVFGILFWLIPYLLLSIGLFLWSYRVRLETLKYGFMLSPLVMAVLVMTEFTLLSMILPASTAPESGLESIFLDTVQINIFLGGITLVWGYICVGLGLGIYRLLRQSNVIRDEWNHEPETVLPAVS